jgi:hypothetical protein
MNAKQSKNKVLHHGGLMQGETLASALVRIQLATDIQDTGTDDVQLLAYVLMQQYDLTRKEHRDNSGTSDDSKPSNYWTADHR